MAWRQLDATPHLEIIAITSYGLTDAVTVDDCRSYYINFQFPKLSIVISACSKNNIHVSYGLPDADAMAVNDGRAYTEL